MFYWSLKLKCQFVVLLMVFARCVFAADSTFILQFDSSTLQRTWNCKVQLPEGYYNSNARYAVIYLLHGSMGNENDWDYGLDILDSLIKAKAIDPLIAVAPASGTSWWVDGRERIESAVIEELIPRIDADYRTISSRDGRVIGGFSMGGYGALRYALLYSHLFGAAILLSPAIYAQQPPEGSSARSSGAFGDPFDPLLWKASNYTALLKDYLGKKLSVPVYIACGDDDWHHEEGLRFNVEQQSTLLYGRLRKELKSPAELRIMDGGHSWKVWKTAFIEGLLYVSNIIIHSKDGQKKSR